MAHLGRSPFSYQAPSPSSRGRRLPPGGRIVLLLGLAMGAMTFPPAGLLPLGGVILIVTVLSGAYRGLLSRQGGFILFLLIVITTLRLGEGFSDLIPALIYGARLLLAILAGHILSSVTAAGEFYRTLAQPLMRLPPLAARPLLKGALVLRLILRWIPLLFQTQNGRRAALLSRGMRPHRRPLAYMKASALPLLEMGLRESRYLAEAMEARSLRLDPTLPPPRGYELPEG